MRTAQWDRDPRTGRGPLGASESTLFEGRGFRLAEFHCDPEAAAWTSTNTTGPWPVVAFPGTPVWIEHEGSPPFVADRSMAVSYAAGQEYARRLLDPRGDHCTFVGFGQELLGELADAAGATSFRSGAWTVPDGVYVELQALLAGLRQDEAPDPLAVAEAVLSVLGSVLAPASSGVPGGRAQHDVAESVRAVLNERFHERLTLEDVARSVHVSRFHMSRIFRSVTGTTVHRYLTDLRLRAALARMGSKGNDLAAIAADLGFAHHSHLTQHFRRRFGAPPSHLRTRSARRDAALSSSTNLTAAAGRSS